MSTNNLSSAFHSASEAKAVHRLTLVAAAHDKMGKSLLCSGSRPRTCRPPYVVAPRPLVLLSLDKSFERLLNAGLLPAEALKDLYYKPWSYNFNPEAATQASKAEAEQIMGEFDEKFAAAVNGGAKTIGIDTESELWELERIANTGRTGVPKKKGEGADVDWDAIKRIYMQRLRSAMDKGVNLILSQKLGKHYNIRDPQKPNARPQWDGRSYLPKGFTDMHFMADCRVELGRDKGGQFTLTMNASSQAPHLFGAKWTSDQMIDPVDANGRPLLMANPEDARWIGQIPVISFAGVAKLCFPESKMSEWGVS